MQVENEQAARLLHVPALLRFPRGQCHARGQDHHLPRLHLRSFRGICVAKQKLVSICGALRQYAQGNKQKQHRTSTQNAYSPYRTYQESTRKLRIKYSGSRQELLQSEMMTQKKARKLHRNYAGNGRETTRNITQLLHSKLYRTLHRYYT